jgi:iron complex outermembrane receptor protein
MTKTILKAGVAASALVIGLAGVAPAFAQAVEEIVVTARKRQEDLQTVPVSITAFSAETIERTGSTNLGDIARFTPGLTYYEGNGGGLAAPTIRGLSATVTTTFDNNVGVFLDGVFLSAKSNINLAVFDLERVEVVRGPQSALYGNNTFAGAINYVTKRPDTNGLEGNVKGTLGTDQRADASFSVSGPVNDKFAVRVQGSYSTFDGTVENGFGSETLGGWEYKAAAATTLNFQPTDNFELTAFYYYGEDELDGSANFIFPNNCGGQNSAPPLTGRGRTTLRYVCGTLKAPDQVFVSDETYSKYKSELGYINMSYDLGGVTLKSLSTRGDYDSAGIADQILDATTGPAARRFVYPFMGPVEEWSQEFRVESFGNDVIDYAGGFYYYDRDATQYFITGNGTPTGAPPSTNVGVFPTRALDQITAESNKTYAGFGLIQAKVTDQIRLNGEARYTKDKRQVALINRLTNVTVPLADDFKYWTWRASVDYQATDDILTYASVSRGAKSGGFNNSPVVSEQSYQPEYNVTYEVGAKTTLLDNRLQANLALFYIDWTDVQYTIPSAVQNTRNYVTNFGAAKAEGFELELNAAVAEGWTVGGGIAYTDPHWVDGTVDFSSTRQCQTAAICGLTPVVVNGVSGFDVSGFTLPRASKWTGSLNTQYSWSMSGDVEPYVRGDLSYRSKQITNAPIALQDNGNQTLVNLRAGATINGNLDVSVWVNNVFDKRYVNNAINEPEFVPVTTFTTGFIGNDRTAGVSASYKF